MGATVTMTRRVAFSAGHRYWRPDLSDAENRQLFGRWASPFAHGHNYTLDARVSGEIDPRTGMVVNIKRVDDVLKARILTVYDGRCLNQEVESLIPKSPTLETLLHDIADRLGDEFQVRTHLEGLSEATVHLTGLLLKEKEDLYAEMSLPDRTMTLTRTYEFAAAHRLHAEWLSEEENQTLFGKCNNPNGHGHNYVLEVTVGGEPESTTGMLVDLGALDAAVAGLVVDRYDHKNLDLDVEELKGKITTSENVARAIFDLLNEKVPARLERIKLWETARNAFEVTREA
ncbi:6-pyruvoyl tetrahydropterin synthase [bacterium]|nr:MAG: 6-pyruvoyl tetrahydropterin synthase [bacterium]